MGRGRARCAGNGVFVEEALVFCGRGIGVFVQFRGRVIGVFVIVALGSATPRGRGNVWVEGCAARGFGVYRAWKYRTTAQYNPGISALNNQGVCGSASNAESDRRIFVVRRASNDYRRQEVLENHTAVAACNLV